MTKEFHQVVWDEQIVADCRQLLRLAVQEDLGERGDCTSRSLVPDVIDGRAAVIARQAGVVAGLPAAEVCLEYYDPRLRWSPAIDDGQKIQPGDLLAQIKGPAMSLLSIERILLNMLGRLSGIATLTRHYVEAVRGTKARIYDTRKTTPGWRRLEKYAVRCGGGRNHRSGLYDAVLVKDNHLALGLQATDQEGCEPAARFSPVEAVRHARSFIALHLPESARHEMIVEVEVDSLAQLETVLPAGPDIVLLDNMDPAEMAQAVALRNARHPEVELEASGGVSLTTVGAIARSGVDRISVGALTHSAVSLDIGLDWLDSRE